MNNMSEAIEEMMRSLRNEEKIHLNNIALPARITNYVIDTDLYRTDDGGYIYDPYEGEYPNIDQIYEQYEYDVGRYEQEE